MTRGALRCGSVLLTIFTGGPPSVRLRLRSLYRQRRLAVAEPAAPGRRLQRGLLPRCHHGWLLSGGTIFHTSDGGLTLTMQTRHNVTFRAITFANSSHGWAVGDPASGKHGTAIIYRTTNGGLRWTRVRLDFHGGLGAVSFDNTKDGWATSREAVWHTTDGGLHWTAHVMSKHDILHGVQARNTRRVWVAGAGDTVLRSVDGGATWQRLHTGLAKNLSQVHFAGRRLRLGDRRGQDRPHHRRGRSLDRPARRAPREDRRAFVRGRNARLGNGRRGLPHDRRRRRLDSADHVPAGPVGLGRGAGGLRRGGRLLRLPEPHHRRRRRPGSRPRGWPPT